MAIIKQFDMLKGSYFTGGEFIPIDELESPIGLRVEGGGYIFYDDTVGFPSSKITIPDHMFATRWGLTSSSTSYGTYYYDMLRGCVVRESAGTCNRFMVVDETDMVSSTRGNNNILIWDTSANASTSRATSTDFGYGSANTTLLGGCYDTWGDNIAGAITDNSTIWPTVKYFRCRNPQGAYTASDSATDTRWFVPSKDELWVLNCMAFYNDSYKPSNSIYSYQLQIPFWPYYWSSSQGSDGADSAWIGGFHDGYMSLSSKENTNYPRVRLCRTF